jgi:hypothetical protein
VKANEPRRRTTLVSPRCDLNHSGDVISDAGEPVNYTRGRVSRESRMPAPSQRL